MYIYIHIHYTLYIYIYLYIINNIYIYSINKLEKFIPPKMMINVIVFYLFLGGYDIHNPLSYISTNYPREVACIWLPPIGIIKYVIICPEPGIYLKIYLSFQLILCPRAIPQLSPVTPILFGFGFFQVTDSCLDFNMTQV